MVAGAVLGAIVWRSRGAEDYVAPRLEAPPDAIPERLSGSVPPGHRVVELEVDGMCCRGCPATLYGALAAVDGVREVAVEFVAGGVPGKAAVVVPSALPAARLTDAIASEKYTVRLLP